MLFEKRCIKITAIVFKMNPNLNKSNRQELLK